MVHNSAGALLRDFGDGLIMRHAAPADADALSAFYADIFRNQETNQPDIWVGAWGAELISGRHPTIRPSDFIIVEDMARGRIASSVCLLSQTWTYGGVPLGFGRPELVATHPDYRQRGLIRAQFEVVHRWSAERSELAQGITGIPCFYRQFGYEMALELSHRRVAYPAQSPKLKEGESEPYRVRPAVEADLPLISQLYDASTQRYLVACPLSLEQWRFALLGRHPDSCQRRELRIIETMPTPQAPDAQAVGFVAHGARLWHDALGLIAYELAPGISWSAVTPSVMRYLVRTGEQYAAEDANQKLQLLSFYLGTQHPVYEVLPRTLTSLGRGYAWYMRVPDVPRFLRQVAPALERNLARSYLVRHTGELKLSFYRSGVRLTFQAGKLASVDPWQAPYRGASASFPGLTFLQLLFGYRSLAELEQAYPDCGASNDESIALLNALFPKQPSNVWPVD